MQTEQVTKAPESKITPQSPLPKAQSKEEQERLQELAHITLPTDRAPAEYGYGVKTEKEIQKEKPRAPSIAVLGPMTGELEFFGNEASNGAELASDELDAEGGINGTEFDLLVFDTKGRIAGARQGIATFVDHGVLAIVGAATGEVSFSASKQLNDNQLIMISAGSRRRLGDTGPYNFRITLDDSEAVKSLMGYIVKEKKWANFAVFSSVVNDYSIKLTASFKNAMFAHNLNLTHELFLWPASMQNQSVDDISIAAQIRKLKKNTPDALIYTGEGKEAREIVKEMRKQRIYIPLVGSEDLMIPEFTSLGKDAYGTIVFGGFNVNAVAPNVQKFVKAYTDKFGKPPTRLSALSYDAYRMLAQAIKVSPSLRPSHVRKALTSIKNFKGVTGKTTITTSGEAVKEPFIFEFMEKGGNPTFIEVKGPA
jgi:branched-chain amino acid transport system substrate-binding protein